MTIYSGSKARSSSGNYYKTSNISLAKVLDGYSKRKDKPLVKATNTRPKPKARGKAGKANTFRKDKRLAGHSTNHHVFVIATTPGAHQSVPVCAHIYNSPSYLSLSLSTADDNVVSLGNQQCALRRSPVRAEFLTILLTDSLDNINIDDILCKYRCSLYLRLDPYRSIRTLSSSAISSPKELHRLKSSKLATLVYPFGVHS